MTDALSLDLDTVAAQASEVRRVRDPWLERRDHGWGASEIASLLLAYDFRDEEWRTARVRDRYLAEHSKHGVPRVVARKAGLGKYESSSGGGEREEELIETWARESGYGDVRLAREAPREFYPLVDRECPSLTCTPDGWCRGADGELVAVEAKCTVEQPPPELHWYWRVQNSAQHACMSAGYGIVVCGPGWVFPATQTRPISWLVMRNEREIDRVRRAAEKAWSVVKTLKERE